MKWLKDYKYKNLTFIALSILLVIFLSKYNFLNQLLFKTSYIPPIGSFIAGALYVSAFTASLGILMLADLSQNLSTIEIAILAGLGGAVADFAIIRFFKNNLLSEITPIYDKLGGQRLTKLMHHKYLRWSLPIVGAIIVMSPFPDELGLFLMGLTRIKNYQLTLLCLALDIIGVFLLVSAFSLIK
ncbi:MAG: hypothetical protein US48_C0034G0003 [Candidatus Levybacteria bacterium GW2011_GWA2_37_36]|nr:MAG: hypothetical protein US43_C0008G0015 [Candidatus Levybacteria bacterium GW2011_GWA1_37_16]KKQ32109.1 MAG: hypothetical protein US48_C0034G0003 [Candidatus Levybacteria bacterium GW2011_GWA2_37_36]KKQ37235.1 MAG: hypothetical protein US55_C0037G0004 [Candidatus Levybacteria bacterium GW2011_GWC2_37_7]KKQ42368.1 MAG: hypothetical protein US59_C0010G0015 [Candidatus Levybacteria bacterium GW2011_GWB1_37_8]OGH51318.1 MAG: hypothetical protein A3H17_00080 [Candidatus Levybacteria bacterium R